MIVALVREQRKAVVKFVFQRRLLLLRRIFTLSRVGLGIYYTKAGQERSASAARRSTRLAMPDTDDEGSVADNASDAGGPRMDAITRGTDDETKVRCAPTSSDRTPAVIYLPTRRLI